MTEQSLAHALHVKLWINEVELASARQIRDRHARMSSMGWLASIGTLAVGTIIAVDSGQKAASFADEIIRLEHERPRLLCQLDQLGEVEQPQ